jgi:hypothetical protein
VGARYTRIRNAKARRAIVALVEQITAEPDGCLHFKLMAIFDWSNAAQAKPYTAAADRKRMAGDAMPLLTKRTS